MTSSELRQSFLEFFKSKNHYITASAPVVPQDDPTLLFTNAGMNQFKDIFLGTGKAHHLRVVDSQKCIRVSGKHNDLEEVGRDTYHHTFFEMLGNWSFGDYFKKEAIAWAWELLTGVWQLPKEKLYASIFAGDAVDGVPRDDEASEEWRRQTDIDVSHVLEFGKKENFWEMGETGPCGPCSEIHIDRGTSFCDNHSSGHTCRVNGDCARYIELWNLVFIQYNRDDSGTLHTLPAKHVDTGAGFERLLSVMQKASSNYDTDLFAPILAQIAEITGKPYSDSEQGVAFRVIADHLRALSFAIADGALPGNEGRGYVLRRILRRAARFGRLLDMHEPFIYKLLDSLILVMGDAYPEIRERKEYIQRVIRSEEESFGRTLDRGIDLFEQKAAEVLKSGRTVFPGKDAFLLHDTYGFPLDLTQLMAEERRLSVDTAAFTVEMDKQRERSSKARDVKYQSIEIDESAASTDFVGYTRDKIETTVVLYEEGKMVLKQTPFYAESGGQIGDSGVIRGDHFKFVVADTKRIGEHVVHLGKLTGDKTPKIGDTVTAEIDIEKRRATERNHTVTHLLHKVLREVLGDHVHQAGSLVHPDYMRFDFTHFERISAQDLSNIEAKVNEAILENHAAEWNVLPIDEAKARGAMALFGEKYGEIVRMVEIQDYSRELCGGTHVRATGEIGLFVIVSESSVAAGVRRIESLTGKKAYDYLRGRTAVLEQAAQVIGCAADELVPRLNVLLQERKSSDVELKKLRQQGSKDVVGELLRQVRRVGDVAVVAAQVEAQSVDEFRHIGDLLRDGLGSGVGVLAAAIQEKVSFVCVVTKDLIGRGLKAGEIVKRIAFYADGSGGGSPHMALAGAKDVGKIAAALAKTDEIIAEMVK
jgi:alanyl-tRNA synthetase